MIPQLIQNQESQHNIHIISEPGVFLMLKWTRFLPGHYSIVRDGLNRRLALKQFFTQLLLPTMDVTESPVQ